MIASPGSFDDRTLSWAAFDNGGYFGDWSLLNGASGLLLGTNYIHSGFIPNGAASLGGSGGGSCGN